MAVILQWLMAKWPGRSVSAITAVVWQPETFKWETAALTTSITSMAHQPVFTATVALTRSGLLSWVFKLLREKLRFCLCLTLYWYTKLWPKLLWQWLIATLINLNYYRSLEKMHCLINNPCVKYQHVCTIEKSGFLPWSWMKLTVAAFTEAQTVVPGPLTLNCDSQRYTNWMLPSLLWQWLTTFFIYHDFFISCLIIIV